MTLRLGLDLGGTSIKWVLLDPDGVVADQGSVPTPTTGVEDTLAAIADVAHQHAGATSSTRVGLAIPASVDPTTSRVIEIPNVAGHWDDVLIGVRLSALTGQPWLVVNDARAFAAGELHSGVARDASEALFVTLGTGVGGALAVRGVLEMGTAGLIGEIGHLRVEPDGRQCGCGHRGCLETYAGAAGMLAEARRLGSRAVSPADAPEGSGSLTDLLNAAAAGDHIAQSIVAEAGSALGTAVGQLATFLAPTLVIIGGGVSRGFEHFEPTFRPALADATRIVPQPEVRLTRRAEFAGAIGAATWASEPTTPHASSTREKP